VVECHTIAGVFDDLFWVERPDMAAWKRFCSEVLGTVASVRSITSQIVMDSTKDLRG